ncbi:MAG: hypothetical protein JNK15_04810 [Planctomycetes bacterium]|nr:hypothetical protein [Planctomycetota bacterium]
MKILLAIVVAAAAIPAQVVRIANHSPLPFHGWKRTTVDVLPPHPSGTVGGATYVLGRPVGLDTHVVDVRVALAPFQTAVLDLAQAQPAAFVRAPFGTAISAFGGTTRIAGLPMTLLEVVDDGAGYTCHWRRRTIPMIAVDVWCTWYPDQPGLCSGEAAITASNPTVPDLAAWLPAGMPLQLGDALTLTTNGTLGTLLPVDTHFADGQSRLQPVTFVWPARLPAVQDWLDAIVTANYLVGACGLQRLHADGNPSYPTGFDPHAWANGNYLESVRRLHTDEEPVVGPTKMSSVTGRQEDQTFVRGEALLPGGVGAEWIAYLNALRLGARPCHHLEEDGRPLDLPLHVNPRLVFWDGRPHWSPVLSPDRLGKPATITPDDAKLWWGPDVEHWFMNTLAAATRLTGSPACQWLLGHQARIYRLQCTTDPTLATSQPFAARAVGWEGMLAVHLYRELEDRPMANAVRLHWQDRVTNVILPAYQNRQYGVWDPRLDDPRLGKGWWWIPWQQAVGAYGLDLGCAVLGPAAGRPVALAAAQVVLAQSFALQNGVWVNRAAVAFDGRFHQDSSMYLFGTPLAPAVVLRHLPNDPVARSIWNQMHADATGTEHTAWFAPGVQ